MGGAARDAHDLGGDAHGGGVGGHLGEHNGVGGDAGVVPHPEGAQHLGPGGDEHVVADGGVALALVLAGAPQGDAVVDQAVVPHLGGFADDDAHAVVDDQAAADFRAGMDLNAGPEPAPLGYQTGQEFQPAAVQKMGQPVVKGGVHAGIEQKNLKPAACRRVPGLVGPQSLAQSGHEYGSLLEAVALPKIKTPHARRHERRRYRGSTLVSRSWP